MNTKFRAGKRTLGVLLIAAFIGLGTPLTVHADTGGGTGGGAGGGSATKGIHWRAAAGAKGYAYNTFLNQSGSPKAWVDRELNKRVKGGAAVCQNSTVIWWLHTSQTNVWVPNYSGKTHGSGWRGSGSIESPAAAYGRYPATVEVNTFKDWDKSQNGTKIDKKPGYTIICSNRPVPDMKRSTPEYDKKTVAGSYNNKAIYSYSTTVAPMRVEGKYVGNGSYESQAASTVKTNFGKQYDSLVADSKKGKLYTPVEVEAKVKAAIAKDAKANLSAQVTLSANNQNAFTKGGILNIHEYSQTASISVTKTDTENKQRTCNYVRKWNAVKGNYDSEKLVNCSAWKTTSITAGKPTFDNQTQTSQNTGFWQMISVHCNKADFDALVKATGAKVINSGDATTTISAVAQSKKYNKQPTVLDFGSSNNSNAAAKASATMAFYDKECPFECVASPDTKQGASTENGAVTNTGTSGTTNGDKNGAISAGIQGNSFEYFRDNVEKKINLDVWYPKTVGVVSYTGAKPLTTTINRWSEGTPSISGAGGGKFTMATSDGTKLFKSNAEKPRNQKNWDTNTSSGSTFRVFDGLQRDFNVKASWASDKGKPHVLNFKWEYAPNVATTFPSQVGFTRTGTATSTAKTAGNVSKTAPIQGKCYAHFGTAVSSNTVESFQKNTGSGTINGLDGVVSVGSKPADSAYNLVINFVRSTTE